jgi:hypothetical protein
MERQGDGWRGAAIGEAGDRFKARHRPRQDPSEGESEAAKKDVEALVKLLMR